MASYPIASKEVEMPNWLELPRDITANILQRLSTIEIVTSVRFVCPIWWNMFKDPLMWRTVRMTNLSNFRYYFDEQSREICYYAIKQSCGHLEVICIDDFATDDLLKFISEKGPRLVNCHGISKEGFSQAVQKLPLLKALNISLCNLSKDSLEVVGQYCPLLTAIVLGRSGCEYMLHDIHDDDAAFVIAKTMVGLRHLNIHGNKLSNAVLLAILDGCPHLEFLDIRRCHNLQLDESLKKKCVDQIKNLLLPEPTVYNFEDGYDDDRVTYWDSIIDDDCYDP